MKTKIHPKWYPKAVVACACGNTFVTGATQPRIQVEICNVCHPFYTGQMKYVDTSGRVDAFIAKMTKAKSNKVVSKTEKRRLKKERKLKEELSKPETLSELRKEVSKKRK